MKETPSVRAPILIGFGALAVTALVLGYAGLDTYLAARTELTSLDLVYYALQLFVMDSEPLGEGGPLPWTLEFARFAAPAVTVYALAEAVRLLLSSELRKVRARETRRHAIVCGTGPLGQTLTQRLREAGRKVVVVGGTPHTPPHARDVFHVTGDARDAVVLRAAGVLRADVVYACEDDATANIAIAATVHNLRRSRPVAAYAHVPDPELCAALRARRLGVTERPEHRLDFFNLDELAVRVLLARDPLREPRPVLLLGLESFGGALLVELARQWRLRVPHGGVRLPVRVIAPEAKGEGAALCRRYPFRRRVLRADPGGRPARAAVRAAGRRERDASADLRLLPRRAPGVEDHADRLRALDGIAGRGPRRPAQGVRRRVPRGPADGGPGRHPARLRRHRGGG
ncbi:NAD-binding protein [Nonomuraea sp. K274]|uniref:NAD-binding protein n=1 Tax=Nonomuraea cypriaca TaxID=1187855 RepID=A0A931A8Z6_9ACTN|nr:NAD-binding protein [Nonomuraea cypriaca]MBF8187200.1 NAD-binding protein [Nonomuraea cypriaca]